jgi:hypothetical protein
LHRCRKAKARGFHLQLRNDDVRALRANARTRTELVGTPTGDCSWSSIPTAKGPGARGPFDAERSALPKLGDVCKQQRSSASELAAAAARSECLQLGTKLANEYAIWSLPARTLSLRRGYGVVVVDRGRGVARVLYEGRRFVKCVVRILRGESAHADDSIARGRASSTSRAHCQTARRGGGCQAAPGGCAQGGVVRVRTRAGRCLI